jgi:hypothetical protein
VQSDGVGVSRKSVHARRKGSKTPTLLHAPSSTTAPAHAVAVVTTGASAGAGGPTTPSSAKAGAHSSAKAKTPVLHPASARHAVTVKLSGSSLPPQRKPKGKKHKSRSGRRAPSPKE